MLKYLAVWSLGLLGGASAVSVRYSDDDCTPDSDDECGDEDRRI